MQTHRFELTKDVTFEAAHMLPNHDGKCARLHGHSWKARIAVSGPQLVRSGPKAGMLVDFGDIKRPLMTLVEERLDHYYLNDSVPELTNPTSEELARWVYEKLEPAYKSAGIALEFVVIEETCTSRCIYSRKGEP